MTYKEMIDAELVKARANFRPINTFHEGIAIIREEYLELEKAIFARERDEDEIRKEAVQTAAMCVRLIEDLLT